jgi:hypothetical protein
LAARLGILLLVGRRVWHGDPRAVHDLDRPSVPVPGSGCLLLEPLTTQERQAGQQRLGQALACFAVPAGERRTRREALGDARGVETCDCRPARGVVTVDLTHEGPERDHRGKDAVSGLDTFLAYEIDHVLDRQHSTERAGTLLEEPAKQALYLCHSSTSDSMHHGRPPWSIEDESTPSMKDQVGLPCLLYISLYSHRLDSRKRHSGRTWRGDSRPFRTFLRCYKLL